MPASPPTTSLIPDVTRPPVSLFAASAAMAIFWRSGGSDRNALTTPFVASAVIFRPPAMAPKSTVLRAENAPSKTPDARVRFC
jgi:hypothetical protein